MDYDDDGSGDEDDGPVKTPTEQPERLKATSSKKEGTKEGQSGKVNPATELARKERELCCKGKDLKADLDLFRERRVLWKQKHDELSETLKREQENYQLKLCKLNADLDKGEYKGLSTEMVDVMMLEVSNRQRELALLDLLHFREAESLNVRKIGLLEEYEFFYREKYAGDETALQQHLLRPREDKEKVQNELLQIRKLICRCESLAAINAKLGSNDKGSATAATSAADPGPVKTPTPTEHAPADTLLSTSVTDNPPGGAAMAASSSSSAGRILPYPYPYLPHLYTHVTLTTWAKKQQQGLDKCRQFEPFFF